MDDDAAPLTAQLELFVDVESHLGVTSSLSLSDRQFAVTQLTTFFSLSLLGSLLIPLLCPPTSGPCSTEFPFFHSFSICSLIVDYLADWYQVLME